MTTRDDLDHAKRALVRTRQRAVDLGVQLPQLPERMPIHTRRWFQWVCVAILLVGSVSIGWVGLVTLIL